MMLLEFYMIVTHFNNYHFGSSTYWCQSFIVDISELNIVLPSFEFDLELHWVKVSPGGSLHSYLLLYAFCSYFYVMNKLGS